MEHIPKLGTHGIDLKVPYFGSVHRYDGQGWSSFPQRAGYPWLCEQITVHEMNERYRECSEHEFRSFAQAWMFFGACQEVLGASYNESDFIENSESDGLHYVHTIIAKDWRLRKYDRKPVIDRADKSTISLSVDHVTMTLRSMQSKAILWDRFAVDKDEAWTVLSISFHLALEMLAMLPNHIARLSEEPLKLDLVAHPGPALDHIRSFLLHQTHTWCVHQLDYLSSRLSYSALIYLTNMERFARQGVDHTNCSNHPRCVAYNVEIGVDQEPEHVQEQCDCSHVEAPRHERVQILAWGGVPVLKCTMRKNDTPELHYVPASPDLKYAAISHLWADGLANTFRNSLPQCVVLRLMSAVRKANASFSDPRRPPKSYDPVYFWLDVYCVPAQVPSAEMATMALDLRTEEERVEDIEMKRKAIARMDATYTWAQYVLAIDAELMQLIPRNTFLKPKNLKRKKTGPQAAGSETIACMGVSAWNTRCWTYQEHALAKRTVLQGNGMQSQFDILVASSAMDSTLLYEFAALSGRRSTMAGDIPDSFKYDIGKKRHSAHKVHIFSEFGSAWNAFYGRTTTQWDDMIVVLANLLDLNAAAVLRLEPRMRMKAILAAQTTLPLALLFIDITRVSESDKFTGLPMLEDRWIPLQPQNAYIECPRAGDVMDVSSTGIQLRTAKLLQHGARILRVSLMDGHMPNAVRVLEKDQVTVLSISIDPDALKQCLQGLPFPPVEAILILEAPSPVAAIDHSLPTRGACLLPAGDLLNGRESTIYVGPLVYHKEVFDDVVKIRGLPLAKSIGSDSLETIQINSDIVSWPKLPKSRSLTMKSLKTARYIVIAMGFALEIAYIAIRITNAQSASEDGESVLGNLNHDPTILIAFGILLLTCIPYSAIAVAHYAFVLQLMYSVHSEIDADRIWWRQLQDIFHLLPLSEVNRSHWFQHILLHWLVSIISAVDAVSTRTTTLFVRRHKRQKLSQDEAVELTVLAKQ